MLEVSKEAQENKKRIRTNDLKFFTNKKTFLTVEEKKNFVDKSWSFI